MINEVINRRIISGYWPKHDFSDEELLKEVRRLISMCERRGNKEAVLVLRCLEKELMGEEYDDLIKEFNDEET